MPCGRQTNRDTVLETDSLQVQAGEGNLLLCAGEGILVQAPRVTVRTPLAINQNRTGRRNPSTGGLTYLSSQYEFSITSSIGELVGTEYEEYNPFENEISYESYEAVEQRRLDGLKKGIITALVVGAAVAIVALTGGVALCAALAVGAVVAGVGILASAVTYMRDKKNNTASPPETYVNNAERASLITASVIATVWAAPYAAKALVGEVSQGLPLTVLFGHVFTLEELEGWALLGTQGTAFVNTWFQYIELLAFFGGTKELGEPTGWEGYDDMKALVEGYSMQLFFMGYAYRLQERAAAKTLAGSEGKQGQGTQAGTQVEGGTPTNSNRYCLSGEEHYEAYKEMFGAENVEWTSRDTLSSADRLRIQNWSYPPKDELYIKYKDVFQNDLYFNQATGKTLWPINDGFAEYPETIILQPGTIIDRYGSDYGTFTSPIGIPYVNRSLAPDTELKPYSAFEVVKPIEVQAGKIAPWFGQPGGGIQYILPATVDELLDPNVGVLRRLQ